MQLKLVSVYKSSHTPFPAGGVASCHIRPFIESLNNKIHYSVFYDVYENKNGEMFFREDEIEKVGKAVFATLLKNPKLLQKCEAKYRKYINLTLKFLGKRNLTEKLRKMTSREIAKLLEKSFGHYSKAAAYPEQPGFAMELGGQKFLRQKLIKYLTAKKIKLRVSKFEEYFARLSNPTQLSFSQKAELELLRMSLLGTRQLKKRIAKHITEYYWLHYDYYGSLVTEQDVRKELRSYKRLSRIEIRKRIKDVKSSEKLNEKALMQVLAGLPLSKDLKKAFKIVRELAYFYTDIKKVLTTRANVGFGQIVKEIAERLKLNEYFLHFATPDELEGLLRGDLAVNDKILKKRSEKSVVAFLPSKKYYEFLNESQANEVRKLAGKYLDKARVTEFKGTAASTGKYTGKVKVITSVSQVQKIKVGDVLVAVMTAVNYVPAMRKAGAIVTDLGGITSHAAIVSRELGVPCVIGTGIATKVLKDGDLVEVNANHGWVRKIK